MIVSCPSCQTRFRLAEELLGPAGRIVRCSVCRYIWFVRGSSQSETLTEPPSVELPDQGQKSDSTSLPVVVPAATVEEPVESDLATNLLVVLLIVLMLGLSLHHWNVEVRGVTEPFFDRIELLLHWGDRSD